MVSPQGIAPHGKPLFFFKMAQMASKIEPPVEKVPGTFDFLSVPLVILGLTLTF